MVYRLDQKPNSARYTSVPPTAEIGYVLNGVFDRSSARAIVGTLIPSAVAVNEGIIYLKDIQMDERGYALWDVTAQYAQNNPAVNSARFSFSTTGGTFHIDGTDPAGVTSYGTNPADFKGLVNVDDSDGTLRCEGTDIVIPQLRRTITLKWAAGVITEAYARICEDCTGCRNSEPFIGRAAKEVMFLGAEGEQGTDVETTVSYHFLIDKNLTGLKYGDITGVVKNGHDILWVRSQNYKDANNKPARKPIAVYVHAPPRGDVNLGALLGFGS